MRSPRLSRNLTTRIVSIVICVTLALCTVLSFGILFSSRTAFAADEGDTSAGDTVKNENGIRFVQVAAGEDFAIGLTFDGRLFGWSLNKGNAGLTDPGEMGTNTLGDYYPSVPTEINVKFYRGPGSDGTTIWGNSDTENGYHVVLEKGKDKIVSIAATRTTAAFVTEKGYIYTWGQDLKSATQPVDNVFAQDSEDNHYLLLRDDDRGNWYEPYIINYRYFGTAASEALPLLIPSNTSTISNLSIAAAEYNYIVSFQRGTGTNYLTYVWGSLMYSVVNNTSGYSGNGYYAYGRTDTSDPLHGEEVFRFVYNTGSSTAPTLVGGGYNVGINSSSASGGTSLQLRGRNFLTSAYNTTTKKHVNTTTAVDGASSPVKYSSTAGDAKNISNGVIGAGGTQEGGIIAATTNYYGRQSGGVTYSLSPLSVNIWGSQGSTELSGLTANRYAVSLGNDVGYGIVGGELYGWGDGTKGQLPTVSPDSATPYSSEPVKLGITGVISVAAGKQKSSDKRAFYMGQPDVSVEPLEYGSDGTTVVGFNDLVKNEEEFITGALTANGITVWSYYKQTPETLTYNGSEQSSDKFIAVYSGYGNNLFAVTQIGKIVRITAKTDKTGYDVEYYDEFKDLNGVTKNWDVETSNVIEFSAPQYVTDGKDANGNDIIVKNEDGTVKYNNYATVKFSVWGADISGVSEGSGNAVFNSSSTDKAFKALVSDNRIGDAYRIITEKAVSSSRFLSVKGDTVTKNFTPVYYFNGVEMTEPQQKNMFDAVIDPSGAISITPKQSSKGQTITVKFYIARFNYSGSFTTEGSGDNAVYYDYLPCEIKFTIADTPTVRVYEAFAPTTMSGETEIRGNSNIPLLDPNNDYNKYYSLAVQDVSTGFVKLGGYLGLDGETFAGNVRNQIMIGGTNGTPLDNGFPADSKITNGNLIYYLGESVAKAKYNNKYQYLFDEKDSDRVEVNIPSSGLISGTAAGSVIGDKNTITVTVPVSGVKADLLDDIATDFDNKYGLYNIVVNAERTAITFSYDVLTFTAVFSSGNIGYTGGEVKGYATTSTTSRMSANITTQTVIKYNTSYQPESGRDTRTDISSYPAIAAIFSMPSLRLKSDKYTEGKIVEGGATDGKNNVVEILNHDTIYVGDTVEIDVKDFFTLTETQKSNFSAYIGFSYKNKVEVESFTEYNNQFTDNTYNNKPVVTLSKSKLVVTPTTGEDIDLDLTIQRFTDINCRTPFAGGNEKITVHIVFDNIQDFDFVKGTPPASVLLTKNETLDLFAGSGSYNESRFVNIEKVSTTAAAQLTKDIQIRELVTSEDAKKSSDRLFSAVRDETTKTSIRLTPYKSGTGMLQFVATVYGKSLFFSIEVNVSTMTSLNDRDDPIIVVDDQYISVDDIKNKLVEANLFNSNASNYGILYDDVKNPDARDIDKNYNAIYFTDESGEEIGGFPPFIKNVVFEGRTSQTPSLRIITNNSSVTNDSVYYMHVMFTSALTSPSYAEAPDGTVMHAILAVKSGKVSTSKIAEIDCRHPESSDWYTVEGSGLSTKVTVNVSYLLDAVGTESATLYDVFLVSSDTSTSEYFNYSIGAGNKTVVIEPLYNTQDKNGKVTPCTVNVSVSNERTYRMISFEVSIDGILTTLPVMTDDEGVIGYGNIWIYSFAIVFGVLAIIFLIRLIVYWKKRAKQRAIIKRNQELIRMRDRMHNKANIASKEQVVRTKLKMDDPKYAKMFNEMRKNKENESGIILENSDLAATASAKVKKNKKKKGGKKTVAELKAELEAKKAAFAAAQAQNAQTVNPFAGDMPMDGGFGAPVDGFAEPMDGGFGAPGGDFGGADGGAFDGTVDGGEIIFDASDMGDGV